MGVGAVGAGVLVAGAASAAVSAYGSYKSAQFQAGVMRQNATIAKQNANIAATQGSYAQYQQGLRTGQEVGLQKAAFAGGNINTQSAGAQNVISGTQKAGVADQSMLHFNSLAAADNYNTQAQQASAQSKAISAAAPINAFGTLLGGASTVGNQWKMYQKFGVSTI